MKKHNFIKTGISLVVAMVPGLMLGADAKRADPAWYWMIDNIILILAVLVIIGVVISLLNLMDAVFESKTKDLLKEHGIVVEKQAPEKKESLLSKLYNKAWSLIPLDKESDIDLGHDYDGIRELDNSLPPWWIYGFYLTIVMGIGYLYVYHVSDIGLSQQAEYALEMEIGEREKALFAARQANAIDEKNLLAYTNTKELEEGKASFITNCAACHGQEGQGGVGPNLTDKFWIHGGSISSVYKTIKNGVPQKGMIPWKTQMQPATILKIASFIQTLQGTDPPGAKASEGDLYEPEEEVSAASIQ